MSATVTARGDDPILGRSPRDRLPDWILQWGLTGLAIAILVLIAYFFYKLIDQSTPVFQQSGVFAFVFDNDWDPSKNIYGAWPLVVGTIVTSALALLLGVPVAVAAAIYVSELCPRPLRGPLTVVIDLLAAVPSVVYGLWGVFVLIPALRPVENWIGHTLSFVPFIGLPDDQTVAGPNYFIAGLILAIMILPITSAIAREVIATVPKEHKEAALALGATRWEMIRGVVLPHTRAGLVAAVMLGLGRAIGEAIAVLQVIGDTLGIHLSLFANGDTIASRIAAQYQSADTNIHIASLVYLALILLVFSLMTNFAAQVIVRRFEYQRIGAD